MNNILYITGVNREGTLMLGGVFQMQDRQGFPLEMSLMECQERGFAVDWLEALCDAWLNDPLKFDSFEREASALAKTDLRKAFQQTGYWIISRYPKIKSSRNPVDIACRYILATKKKGIDNTEAGG